MKSKLYVLIFLVAAAAARGQSNNITSLLQQGLLDEQANGNLNAAIADYRILAEEFDKNRPLAATAVYRLGECYRAQGKTNEAAAQYQRILREFTDQETLATLSRQNLAGLGATPAEAPPAENSDVKLWEAVKGLPQSQLEKVLPTLAHDSALENLAEQKSAAEIKLAELRNQYGGEHAFVKNQKAVLKTIAEQVAVRIDGVMQALKLRAGMSTGGVATSAAASSNEGGVAVENLQSQYALLKAEIEQARKETNYGVVAELFNDDQGLAQNLRDALSRSDSAMVPPPESQYAPSVKQARQKILDYEEIRLKILQSAIGQARAGQTTPTSAGDQAFVDNEEDAEIKRIRQMIQNSPDLINGGQLGQAANRGALRVATFLLDQGADVNAKYNDAPPLIMAAMSAQRAMVELLLSRGADVNSRDGSGKTALFTAAEGGYLAVVEVLLAHKPDVDADAPLQVAAGKGYANLVKLLLAAGANPNVEGAQRRTPLSVAAGNGHPEIVKMLLAAKADPNSATIDAPLMAAIDNHDASTAQLLLEAGADPNAPQTINYTVSVNDVLYTGAPVSVTPLFFAVASKQLPMVRLLLKFKADPNDTRTEKRSLLFPALAESGILEALLDAGVNVDGTDTATYWNKSVERTPLDAAADVNNADAVEILLKHGANANADDERGDPPLVWAALKAADAKVFRLLLDAKANPNVRDMFGRTPLDLIKNLERADKKNEAEDVELLHQHGALDNLPDWNYIEVNPDFSRHFMNAVFVKGTNDWNQFTLLETILDYYIGGQRRIPGGGFGHALPNGSPMVPMGNRIGNQMIQVPGGGYWDSQNSTAMPFPDLTRVVIVRPSHDSTNLTRIPINLLDTTHNVDCSKDVPLKFGDVVEIPQCDHPLGASLWRLSDSQISTVINYLHGTAQLVVRDQKAPLPLDPWGTASTIGPVLRQTEAQQILLASSDLSRVMVTRHDSKTGKEREWVLDCSTSQSPDLWLRDGDVITVPEKP
jgi:ankyrin repeat protein